MAQSTRIPRTIMLWTVLTVCGGAGVAGAAQPPAGNPLQVVPADALFCLRLNKLSATLGQMDQFLTGVSPVGVSMPVRAQLGQLLGGPEPNGVNMAGDFAVFGPLPGGEAPNPKRIGLLIPLSDYQKFLTNPNVTKPDAQGIARIGPEGKQSIAAERAGNYMLLTGVENEGGLVEMKKWMSGSGATTLAQRLGADELKRSDDAPAWVYINMQIVAKTYGPQLQEKLKEAQKNIQEMQAKGQPVMGQPGAFLDVYANLINSLMQETQFVSLTLNPSATVIRAALVAAAMPNTEMAKNLSMETPPPQPNLMGYLENGAIANFVANIHPALLRAISLRYMDIFTSLAGPSTSKEDVAKLRQLMLDSTDALGGALAIAYLPAPKSKPPFAVTYVATLRDKQKFNRVLDEAPKLMTQGPLADFYAKMGVKFQFDVKRGVETYKGISVDDIRFAVQPTDANSPQAQMLKSMYGEGANLRLAVVNNLVVYALAQEPEKAIHTLIDEAAAGGPSQVATEIQAALALLPDAKKSQLFGTFNILRAMQTMMTLIPMAAPPAEVPTQTNIAFAGQIGGGRLRVETAVPKQHVLEVMAVAMKMQQQKTQQQQPETPQAQPQGQPPAKPERGQF